MTQPDGAVKLRYQGFDVGPFRIMGPISGTLYRFGQDVAHCERWVRAEDVDELLARSSHGVPHFVRVSETAAPTPLPIAVTVTPEAEPLDEPAQSASVAAANRVLIQAAEFIEQTGGAPVSTELIYASVLGLTTKQVRDLAAIADAPTLMAWLHEERASEKPRSSIIAVLSRALAKLPEARP